MSGAAAPDLSAYFGRMIESMMEFVRVARAVEELEALAADLVPAAQAALDAGWQQEDLDRSVRAIREERASDGR